MQWMMTTAVYATCMQQLQPVWQHTVMSTLGSNLSGFIELCAWIFVFAVRTDNLSSQDRTITITTNETQTGGERAKGKHRSSGRGENKLNHVISHAKFERADMHRGGSQ